VGQWADWALSYQSQKTKMSCRSKAGFSRRGISDVGFASRYQIVFSTGLLRILWSRVIWGRPSARPVAPINRSAGSRG